MSKSAAIAIAVIVLSTLLALTLAEVVLRVDGKEPWSHHRLPHHVARFEYDSVVGWRNRGGVYELPGYSRLNPERIMTISPEGYRSAGPLRGETRAKLVILGGSYAHGWMIPDEETLAWKLQQQYPGLQVFNYGTGGYGTLQCLLILEEVFRGEHSPDIVFYGFADHHESRNVAAPSWLKMLSRYRRRGHVDLPYCSLNRNGALVRHAPMRYPEWPGCTRLATVACLQDAALRLTSRSRIGAKVEITEQLFLEMRNLCDRNGAQFVLLFLSADSKAASCYQEFLEKSGIQFVDCAWPNTTEYCLPSDPHPNGAAHTIWGEKITDELGERLRALIDEAPGAAGG